MNERILLTETYITRVTSVLRESRSPGGVNVVSEASGKGTIIEFAALPLDTETGNTRIYPTKEISPALDTSNKLVEAGETVLRCTANGHPAEEVPEPTDSSHKILESWIKDGYVYCKAKVLNTAHGNSLLGLIEEGDPIGVSVRGIGSLNGRYVTDYTFLGAD
jgi:hypothetical protein